MKGVLICGGSGTRLRPLTEIANKSLLPVYDRPLIEYPLGILLGAGIRNVCVVSGTEHIDQMEKYLKGRQAFDGCDFQFRLQEKPAGIAHALGLTEDFAAGDSVCAILGDNVYFDDLGPAIRSFRNGAHVFLKEVADARRFGVASLVTPRAELREDARAAPTFASHPCRNGARTSVGKRDDNAVLIETLEEKPEKPKSNFAITGCYLYDSRCFEAIRNLKPSARGEYEITDVSRWFLDRGELTATVLKDEWIDAGTFESLFRAAQLVRDRKSV